MLGKYIYIYIHSIYPFQKVKVVSNMFQNVFHENLQGTLILRESFTSIVIRIGLFANTVL